MCPRLICAQSWTGRPRFLGTITRCKMFRTDSEKARSTHGSFRHPVPPPPLQSRRLVSSGRGLTRFNGIWRFCRRGRRSAVTAAVRHGLRRGHPTKIHVESLPPLSVGWVSLSSRKGYSLLGLARALDCAAIFRRGFWPSCTQPLLDPNLQCEWCNKSQLARPRRRTRRNCNQTIDMRF
jgi:hypothetical protein